MNSTHLLTTLWKTHGRKAVCALSLLLLTPSTLLALPSVIGTACLEGQTVAIRFAAAVDPVTATESSRYAIAGATVQNVVMPDSSTVLLAVTGLTGTEYTVSGTGIKDAFGDSGNFAVSGFILDFDVAEIGALAGPSFGYAYTTSSIAMKVDGGFVWGPADTAKYVYQTRTGDFDVRVKVNKAGGGNLNSNFALDARESLAPGSRHVAITVYPFQGNWTAFFRETTDGETAVMKGDWRVSWPAGADYPNIWLRIKYKNNAFSTYGSTDGLAWTQIGNTYTPATPYTAEYIGVTAATIDAGIQPVEAEFSQFGNYELGNASIVIHEQPQSTFTTENNNASFSVGAELVNGPPGALEYQWLSNGVAISQAYSSVYTVQGVKLSNSGDIYSVIISAPGVQSVTSDPAVLTVGPDTIAPYALSAGGIPGRTVAVKFSEFMDPVTAEDPSLYSLGALTPVEWAILQEDQQTVVLGASTLSESSFTLQIGAVKDKAGNPVNTTVNGTILNFTAEDIGFLVSPSLVYADSSSHVVSKVDGGVIWFGYDSASYLYQTLTNDFDVRVRIDKFQGSANGNVVLNVRESTAQGSRHVAITVYPFMANWTSFYRDTTEGPTSVFPGGDWRVGWPVGAGYPNIWMRVKRSGDTFSTFGSTDGLNWIQIGANYIPSAPFAETLLVGIAAATTDTGMPPQVFEFSNFGEFSISGASIQITQQPVSISVEENHPATFTIGAEILNGPQSALTYQWQRNGIDISGANTAAYTLPMPTFANSGDQIRVRLSAPGLEPVSSSIATLTVISDTTPPAALLAGAIKSTSVAVQFNEPLDPVTATDPSRYSLGGPTIESVTLIDAHSIVLRVPNLVGPSFALQVNGIADMAGNLLNDSMSGPVQDYEVLDINSMNHPLNSPSQVYAFTPDTLNVVVDGGFIWEDADSGNFIGRNMTGDFDVRVQVSKVAGGNRNSNMLLDVRESTDPGSRHIAITVYPSQGLWVSFLRADASGAASVFPGAWSRPFPTGTAFPNVWLRIRKVGNTYTTFGSTNGFDWLQVGNAYTPATPYTGTFVGMGSATIDAGLPPLRTEFSNFGPTIGRPSLTISAASGSVTLAWPLEATGFRLQKSAQLGAAASWSDVTEPVIDNAVTLTPGAGPWFYRLVQ